MYVKLDRSGTGKATSQKRCVMPRSLPANVARALSPGAGNGWAPACFLCLLCFLFYTLTITIPIKIRAIPAHCDRSNRSRSTIHESSTVTAP